MSYKAARRYMLSMKPSAQIDLMLEAWRGLGDVHRAHFLAAISGALDEEMEELESSFTDEELDKFEQLIEGGD